MQQRESTADTGQHAAGVAPIGSRKLLGAWATPDELVRDVVARTVTDGWLRTRLGRGARSPLRVLDPACGDGRFLIEVARRACRLGAEVHVVGVDRAPEAISAARARLGAEVPGVGAHFVLGDALDDTWLDGTWLDGPGHDRGTGPARAGFDLVIGNPPFLSQLASATSRGGASRHGGGPYADAAAEFLARSLEVADPDGGRVALVLPQSILASRDAAAVRRRAERCADMIWSWWEPELWFDAQVVVCALGFELRQARDERSHRPDQPPGGTADPTWAHVVTRRLGIPDVPALHTDGALGDRTHLSANFRDEYYGLIPAVYDAGIDAGTHREADPPLVTCGLIRPGRCDWGLRPVRFAKRRFDAPRVDLGRLGDRMCRWAERKLVAKVVVSTQTSTIEAAVDARGAWLPGVPTTSVVPISPEVDVWAIGALLNSPIAAVAAWHRVAGTGLSARVLRIGPAVLAGLAWPAGSLTDAADQLRRGNLVDAVRAVHDAYGIDGPTADLLTEWWARAIDGRGTPRPS